jgi:uncharacterized protein YkwD
VIGHTPSTSRVPRVVTILLAALLVITSLTAVPATAADSDAAHFEDRILQLLNADRREKGLHPLQRATQLDAVARRWSAEMADDAHMSHNPRYSTQIPSGWSWCGENVAYGYQTPEAMYRGWYNSPGHYKNMFSPTFTHIGIGIAYGNDPVYGRVPYGTQNFASYSDKDLAVTPRPRSTPAPTPPARSIPTDDGTSTSAIDDGGIGGTGHQFHLANTLSGKANAVFEYGNTGGRFYVGDWDGNGTDTLAYRIGTTFYFRGSNSAGKATQAISYGRPGDRVYVGDWNGDGKDTLAVRRGNTYHVKNSIAGGDADRVVTYGRTRDDVLVGDWDGNGSDTFTVRRGRTYYIANAVRSGDADRTITYGRANDDVYVGDWDGDRTDTFSVRRGATYYIANALRGGDADRTLRYGHTDDTTLAGDWDGDGRDSLGIRR